MQTSRDVIDSLLRKKPADRVGVMDSPWPDTLKAWVKQGMPVDEKGEPVDIFEHFGFDVVGVGGWFDWYPKRGVQEIVEETAEWKVVRHGTGAVLKWWKDKSGTPEHVDFDMSSREVWERDYRPLLLDVDRERVDIKGAAEKLAKRRTQGRWTHFGHCFIWEMMRGSMGDYTMYMSLLADPGWIRDFNRVYTDFCKTYFRMLIEEAGRPDGIWLYEDLGYKHRLFASPKVLEELIFPYYAELVAFFHGYDLPVVLHSCGFTEPALDLICSAGFDGLNPMEVKAGNDPLRIAEKYGDRLTLVGGLDARVLESGDRGLIRREVSALIEGMKSRGARYVFASDHSLSTNVRYDDFRCALEVYREHMMY
jgi:uroporphyrinogen decarboxylase